MNRTLYLPITATALGVVMLTMSVLPAAAQTEPRRMPGRGGRFVSGTSMVASSTFVGRGMFQRTGSSTPRMASSTQVQRLQSRSNNEIDQRIRNLNNLITRIQSMKKVSDTDKSNLSSTVQAQVTVLTDLKTKIAADTDAATLKTDTQSITKAYRIYALVMPQISILATVDRALVLSDALTTISSKLAQRIATAQTAGTDVTAMQTALTDMNAKISDARTQAQAAESSVSGLTPDNGDQSKLQSNNAAMKTAQADVRIANKDLQTARQDAGTITKLLKTSGGGTPTTTP